MIELKKSGVIFNEEEHTYWLNGKQLSGITGVINRQLFPNKFTDVPQSVLAKRAEFGHEFHADMEMFIKLGIESDTDIFKTFKQHYGDIKFAYSEYIVTDGEHFASPIDAIDEDLNLYDFKTTTKKDVLSWRWQLSIYKYFFYLQNGFYPKDLKVLWINKDLKHELIDIEPIDEQAVKDLLQAEVDGLQYVPAAENESLVLDGKLEKIAFLESQIQKMENEAKQLSEKRDELKKALLTHFVKNGIKKWETDNIIVTVKAATTRTSVDSKALKEHYPEVYNEVLKETKVKESLVIKTKE